jgi:hypothetical protein
MSGITDGQSFRSCSCSSCYARQRHEESPTETGGSIWGTFPPDPHRGWADTGGTGIQGGAGPPAPKGNSTLESWRPACSLFSNWCTPWESPQVSWCTVWKPGQANGCRLPRRGRGGHSGLQQDKHDDCGGSRRTRLLAIEPRDAILPLWPGGSGPPSCARRTGVVQMLRLDEALQTLTDSTRRPAPAL